MTDIGTILSYVSNLLKVYATKDRIYRTTMIATVQSQYFDNKMCINSETFASGSECRSVLVSYEFIKGRCCLDQIYNFLPTSRDARLICFWRSENGEHFSFRNFSLHCCDVFESNGAIRPGRNILQFG